MTSDTTARDRLVQHGATPDEIRRGGGHARRLGARPRAHVLAFLLLALTVYGATANYSDQQITDAVAVALPMWSVVERGTVDVAPHQDMSPWFFEVDGRYLSNRWPGSMLVALPAYALASPWLTADEPRFWPASVAAVVVAAAAATALFALVLRMHGVRVAWAAGLVVAFGTGMWTNAADALWTHGPAVLAIAIVLHGLCSDRQWLAGVGFGLLAIVRPHLLAAAAIIGYVLARERRDVRTLVRLGVPSAVGLAAYVAYGRVLMGGGVGVLPYAFVPPEGWQRLGNVVGVLVAPRVGLLVYTPVIACCLLMIVTAWRAAKDWERATFFGGAVYLVVQLQSNYFFGGYAFYGYRLPLEALALMLPILVRGGVAFAGRGRRHAQLVAALGAYSVGVSAIGAALYHGSIAVRSSPWTTYGPVEALAGRPLWVVVPLVVAVLGLTAWATRWPGRGDPQRAGSGVGPPGVVRVDRELT